MSTDPTVPGTPGAGAPTPSADQQPTVALPSTGALPEPDAHAVTAVMPESVPAPTTASEPVPGTGPEATLQPGPGSAPRPGPEPTKLRPRTGPIVWGALILMFCAYVAVQAMGGAIDPIAWLITAVLGIGTLLLIVGVVVLARGSRNKR